LLTVNTKIRTLQDIIVTMCFLISSTSLLLAVMLVFASANENLYLNPDAKLVREVQSVTHVHEFRQVVIKLAEYRRCNRPTFMVRLSGPSLYLLDQVQNNSTNADRHVFEYPPLIDPGLYFLEVLTIYCQAVRPKAFAKICLVSPLEGRNVLTHPYSFEVNSTSSNAPLRPRWVLAQNATPALLPTRYQKMCGKTFCVSEPSDIDQHNQYQWTDKPAYEHLINRTLERGLSQQTTRTGNESITICMVGDSHTGQIYNHGNNLMLSNVRFWWIGSRFPQMFDVTKLANCTYAVVGYGQWPLSSWMAREPYNSVRYEAEMRKVISAIASANLSIPVFIHSQNLNGFGYLHTKCPTRDFRHPPLVMMYNNIVARLTAEFNVPFIDMFPLQGPLWDIALDWSHPKGRVFTAEAEFVVYIVLSYSHKHNRAPVLDPNYASRVLFEWISVPIRFAGSDAVYVLDCGHYRAVQNWKTLQHLGYAKNGSVEVVDASRKSEFKFGPVLPDI